jgi:hypothetical protein
MDPSSILALTRGMERLAIVGLSGLSLVLGWDLFRRGVLVDQTADLKGHGWTIRLQRVGPGIFFALFGTIAFASAIAHPLEITTGRKTQQESKLQGAEVSTVTTESQTVTDAANSANTADRDVIAAVNTVHLLLIPRIAPGLDANYSSAIDKADRTLDSYKKSLMFQHFGQMSIQFYSVRDKVPADPSILGKQTKDFQDKYAEIESWDKDTFLRRR